MKKILLVIMLFVTVLTAFSCKDKELTPVNNVDITPGTPTTGNPTGGVTFDPATQTLVSQGAFKNEGHPTSGIAKLYKKGNSYTLVFESFKSDQGPDLRIYLSADTGAKNFIELTELKNTGNFYLTLPDSAKADERKFVLIWCKRFSVLFGSAELKAVNQK